MFDFEKGIEANIENKENQVKHSKQQIQEIDDKIVKIEKSIDKILSKGDKGVAESLKKNIDEKEHEKQFEMKKLEELSEDLYKILEQLKVVEDMNNRSTFEIKELESIGENVDESRRLISKRQDWINEMKNKIQELLKKLCFMQNESTNKPRDEENIVRNEKNMMIEEKLNREKLIKGAINTFEISAKSALNDLSEDDNQSSYGANNNPPYNPNLVRKSLRPQKNISNEFSPKNTWMSAKDVNKNDIELIEQIEKFSQASWVKLTEKEKRDEIVNLANFHKFKLGIKGKMIINFKRGNRFDYDDIAGQISSYLVNDRKGGINFIHEIDINKDFFNDPREIFLTIAHECIHGKQDELAYYHPDTILGFIYKKNNEEEKYIEPEEVKVFGYLRQRVELDAREYEKKIKEIYDVHS